MHATVATRGPRGRPCAARLATTARARDEPFCGLRLPTGRYRGRLHTTRRTECAVHEVLRPEIVTFPGAAPGVLAAPQLLQRATDPLQVLAVERELERARTDLDRIKGQLAALRDRAARATVAIALSGPMPDTYVPPEPHAYIARGLRGAMLLDLRPSGTNAYVGGGLSFRFPRAAGSAGLVLDVDVLRSGFGSSPDRSA